MHPLAQIVFHSVFSAQNHVSLRSVLKLETAHETWGLAPANFTWRSCSRLAGSLELAEKLNNYLNI
jgi:hypothetical protein